MTTPRDSSTYEPSWTAVPHEEDETVLDKTGSENCMMRASPTRFIDVMDSCCLCCRPLECEGQVRLKCGHQYHLSCYMRHARQNDDVLCIKCNTGAMNATSPIVTIGNIEQRMFMQYASRPSQMLRSENIYSPPPGIEST